MIRIARGEIVMIEDINAVGMYASDSAFSAFGNSVKYLADPCCGGEVGNRRAEVWKSPHWVAT